MKNKLPKVYANNITKKIDNNEKIYTSMTKTKTTQEQNNQQIEETQQIKSPTESNKTQTNQKTKQPKKYQQETITQKINKIMNTKEYIYKIPVKITTKTKEIQTKIIGKNSKNLITIENELIKIEDIINIEIYKDQQEK